jgi:hypothetical protein
VVPEALAASICGVDAVLQELAVVDSVDFEQELAYEVDLELEAAVAESSHKRQRVLLPEPDRDDEVGGLAAASVR